MLLREFIAMGSLCPIPIVKRVRPKPHRISFQRASGLFDCNGDGAEEFLDDDEIDANSNRIAHFLFKSTEG